MIGRNFIAIGVYPPPVTGQSSAFLNFVDSFLPEAKRINVSGGVSGLSKFKKLLVYIFLIARMPFLRHENIYYSLNSGAGLYLDFALLGICKILSKRIVLHHHSYGYINQKNKHVEKITKMMDGHDLMIFLSKRMSDDFKKVYRHQVPSLSLNNIFQYPNDVIPCRPTSRHTLNIGFISNITVDKGFLFFCDLMESAVLLSSSNCKFMIAGDFNDEESRLRFESLSDLAKSRIEYFGSIYGEKKSDFLSEIDLLLFPSIYKNEAQPLVIIEALLYGVMVISTDVGTIPELLGKSGGHIFRIDDFMSNTLSLIDKLNKSGEILPDFSSEAHNQYLKLKMNSEMEIIELRKLIYDT